MNDKENDKENLLTERQVVINNIQTVTLYSLSMIVALGLNDLVLNIFDSFPRSSHVISKVTYIMIMFGFTLLVGYYKVKS
jgi:hypothetical protein